MIKIARKPYRKTFENAGTIAANGGIFAVPIPSADLDSFAPFNEMEITNLSDEKIEVRINSQLDSDSNRLTKLPKNTAFEFDKFRGIKYSSVFIVNLDATNAIAAEEITVEVKYQPEV